MTFYDPEGKEVSKEDFITLYNQRYYLNSEPTYYITQKRRKHVGQNSIYIEKEIDELLRRGITREEEVMRILAWKIGKIKHRESETKKEFIYAKDWVDCEKSFKVRRFNELIDYKYLVNDIINNIDRLECTSPWEVFSFLNVDGPKGIGTVYIIALLNFISKGEFPIYDKYAHIALDAIINNKKPGELVPYKALPDKKSDVHIISHEYINNYNLKLSEIFGDAYNHNRDIDRALWVYGHLFPNEACELLPCS